MVEDDIGLAQMVRHFLEYESHTVTQFHNGLDAQTHILANHADLIILDWDLPGLSGIEILRDYRSFGGQSPVIMLTGHTNVDDKEQGFEDGADDYLTKPFSLKELNARIKGLLRRSQAAIGNVVTVGDIVVDLDTSKVMKAGRSVMLVPREFQLLSYLVKNRKETPTADELLVKVWNAEAEMTPEMVFTTVRRLAKKLDPDGKVLRLDGIMNSVDFRKLSGDSLSMPGATSGGSIVGDEGDPMIGRTLDNKYEIIKVIGGGASGNVYKAKHKMMNVTVAVKVLAPQLCTQTELVKRFEREARAAGLLSHNNLLVVHDLGLTEESQPYMVMEYLNGFSLSQLLDKNGKLAVPDCIEIISQICRGMAKAHEEGLVHRDLKPGNVMLVAEGEQSFTAKIVDFGLAKLLRPEEQENLTLSGAMIGTPSYMSPEQCRSESTDHRADIYSIGCILYEMLTGRKPFESSNVIEIYIKHTQEAPPLLVLADVDDQTLASLQSIIHRCMEKDKESRYQSANELLHNLGLIRPQS